MPPIVKESETAVATPSSAAPATTVAKTKDESPARPQPVALEIPVTVNGARTVEGSDKREPFSENTKTVLVFVHGAVIRLASSLAPGQLIFLTNEKTKKEVVCQVVKSKNYRSVTGYVELEFTEPALGFWGMRFPSDRLSPAPSVAPPAPRAVAPIVSAPPKAVPPPSAPPAIAKPPAPVASVHPAASVPAVPKPTVVAPPPAPPAPPVVVAPIIPPPPHATPVSPAPVNSAAPLPAAVSATLESVLKSPINPLSPAPDFAAAISSLFDAPAVPAVKPAATEPPKSAVATTPGESSSDQLKQQTARLQEQLGSLLFTETPAARPPAPIPAATPKPSVPLPEVADKLLQLAHSDVKPATPPDIKTAAPVRNFAPASLAVEEVKIPSWLAPLARESESTTAEVAPELPPLSDSLPASASSSNGVLSESIPETHHRSHSAVFGGQLLGENAAATPAPASGSKKGLIIGIAATLLLAGGAFWYSRQPDNLISSLLASKSAPVPAQNFTRTSAPASTVRPTVPDSPSIVKPAPAPASSAVVVPSEAPTHVVATPAPPPAPAAKSFSTATHSAPAVEPPAKPTVGEVHLATPVLNRPEESQSGNDAEPTIDSNPASNTDPLAGLAAGHGKEPTAPVPIGGDVKQARLLKSVPPIYPSTARTQHISGAVKIDALIDANGNVSSVTVLSGPGMLHQAALVAVKQWKYEPAQLNGKPTPVHLTVTVQFHGQ